VRRSRTQVVFGIVLVVLTAALLAVAMTAWAVVRARQQRLEREARPTSWAAELHRTRLGRSITV
jgi:cytochrome c-type biogenesis protein CcmH/NrfG